VKALFMTHRYFWFILMAISTLVSCNTAEDDPAGGNGNGDGDADADAGADAATPAEPDSAGIISCKEFFQVGEDFGVDMDKKFTDECQLEWPEDPDAGPPDPPPDAGEGEEPMTEEEALAQCADQYYCREENLTPRCQLAQINLMPKLYRCLLNLECEKLEELGSFLRTLEVAEDMAVDQAFVDSLGKFPCKAPLINFINPNSPSGEFCSLQDLNKQRNKCLEE
jgi:hypothetical protein